MMFEKGKFERCSTQVKYFKTYSSSKFQIFKFVFKVSSNLELKEEILSLLKNVEVMKL